MRQLRLPVVTALACAGAVALPAAAQARIEVKISRLDTSVERRANDRVLARVCVRTVTAPGGRYTATLRSNFLLQPLPGERGSQGFTIEFALNGAHRTAQCERRYVNGVVEDVQRRLRLTAQPGPGIAWVGPTKVGPGHVSADA